jgi:CheY-like chemotaxis protein
MDSRDLVLAGVKILISDDEPEGRELTKRLLILYHANVIAAATALEGLEQLRTLRPDVIVSDIDMPQMDGYQFIRAGRNLPAHRGGQTPAIAFTAFSRREDRTNAITAGFQKYLSKPVDFEEFIDTIAAVTLLH